MGVWELKEKKKGDNTDSPFVSVIDFYNPTGVLDFTQ